MAPAKKRSGLFSWLRWDALRGRMSSGLAVAGAQAEYPAIGQNERPVAFSGAAAPEDVTIAETGSTPLSALRAGDSGIVCVFSADSHRRLQLMEMGLTPGTTVKVLRTAAFGGPLDLLLRGYRLSLRRDEAEAIQVLRA